MWIFQSPIGKMTIRFVPSAEKYILIINDSIYGHYISAVAAADDVYTFSTGCYDWDRLASNAVTLQTPVDISEWFMV